MFDDDLKEKEEKSLLKDMAKKGISKKIKSIPLGTKVFLFITIGIVAFLLIFIILTSALSILFFFNGMSDTFSNLAYIGSNAEDNYWWPVGGAIVENKDGKQYATGNPTSTSITSYFSNNRTINGVTEPHDGMDIGSSGGTDYIIAAAKGTVYSFNDNCDNNGYYGNTCGGGGFGNYVIIEHPGSVYTIYAHLYPGSITVSSGDSIEQGQIIGRMGNSGSSTGTHLHFQIEVGGRGSFYAVDSLNYVSTTNSRPITVVSGSASSTGSELLAMLQSWEGTGPTDGNYYVVYDDGGGTLTVGHGVTLKHNVEKFAKRGIDVSTLSKGSKLPKNIIDSIELEEVEEKKVSVEKTLANNNITLKDYQVDALVIRAYNTGNIKNFSKYYNQYGNTESLYENYMSTPVTGGGKYMEGLRRRRDAEWNLFHNGIYTFNS